MASRTPLGAAPGADDAYLAGWAALSTMIERGQSWSGRERDNAFVNLGDGGFVDTSFVSGLDFLDDGRAVAATDWDGDGAVDLWLKNRTGPQLRFLHNDAPAGHWLEVKLHGATCNRDAVGARVVVEARGRRLRRSVVAGDGYLAQSSGWLHFGLGPAEEVERLIVRWPGGGEQTLEGLAADRRYVVRQGQTVAEARPPRRMSLAAGAPSPAPPGPTRVLLKEPLPLPPGVLAAGGAAEGTPSPRLINLAAAWCAPCLEELAGFAAGRNELDASGLRLVVLSLDPPEQRESALRALAAASGGLAVEPAGAGLLDTLDVLLTTVLGRHDELALPTSLLVDARGALQMIYLGPVTPGRLAADAAIWAGPQAPPPARRSLRPGRWFYRTPRDLAGLAEALRRRGRDEDAAFYAAAGGG